jgi:hypothetical protein
LPPTATAGAISVEVKSLDGASSLHLGPLEASSHHFSLASLPQYGPQVIDIQCRFSDPSGSAAIDVLAEGQDETHQNIATYYFTAARPNGEFTYVAGSPFRYGYRWRVQGGGWSDVLHPGLPLVIDSDALSPGGAAAMVDDFDGLHVFTKDGDESSVYYIPGAPTPELGPNGQPTLMLFASGTGAILQLGARWAATDAQVALLRAEVEQKYPALQNAKLLPAPVTVRQVVVSLSDGAGHWTPLQSSSSSGYSPYNTVFNISLDSTQRGLAIAAINGRTDCLRVEFQLAMPPEVAATFAASSANPRITDVSTWFPNGTGHGHIMLTGASLST